MGRLRSLANLDVFFMDAKRPPAWIEMENLGLAPRFDLRSADGRRAASLTIEVKLTGALASAPL